MLLAVLEIHNGQAFPLLTQKCPELDMENLLSERVRGLRNFWGVVAIGSLPWTMEVMATFDA